MPELRNRPRPGAVTPSEVTLADWRIALITMGRYDDVEAAVIAARDGGTIEGKVMWQRWEYANVVRRSELLEMAPGMGFTAEEVDESLAVAMLVAAA